MVCHFTNPPKAVPDFKRNLIMLDEDWCFEIDGKKTWIPKGYVADGASIPPGPAWWIIGTPFEPRFWPGFFAHDWEYLTHLETRAVADEVIFQFFYQCKTPLWKCRTVWGTLRAVGYPAWRNDEDDKRELAELKKQVALRPDWAKFRLHT